jgi:O-antigen ligase
LYTLPTVGFIYSELSQRRGAMPLWQKLMLYAAAVMTMVFIIYIDSRAGILCLYGVEVLCALHFAQKRGWRKGVLLALLSVGLTFTAEKTLPNHNSRLPIASLASTQAVETDDGTVADTVATTAPAYGKYNDARMAINVTAVKTVADSPVFGYGVGDYDTVLTKRLGTEGYPSLEEQQLNAHNQYTETALAIGIVGLAAMLWWLVMPLCVAWRRKAGLWPVMVLTFIVMFCLLFESMLERQMGMQFVSLLYALMVLIMTVDQGKTHTGQQPVETKD